MATKAEVHIEEMMGPDDRRGDISIQTTDYQVTFSVGVQHFDIGPRYDNLAEAEWFMSQFKGALDKFVKITTGVTLV